jgi:hypothetical protein
MAVAVRAAVGSRAADVLVTSVVDAFDLLLHPTEAYHDAEVLGGRAGERIKRETKRGTVNRVLFVCFFRYYALQPPSCTELLLSFLPPTWRPLRRCRQYREGILFATVKSPNLLTISKIKP